ncbi:MAG: hypothetical protein M3Z75_31010 [Actinomycetota bacterium]|nr:hypothetical protein [Actinomycetota bacterium]
MQLGLQSFSQNVPRPVAVRVVQLVQAMFPTPQPLSAHASVMAYGRTLSRCGGALVQSATTPGEGEVVAGAELAEEMDGDGVVTGDGTVVAG